MQDPFKKINHHKRLNVIRQVKSELIKGIYPGYCIILSALIRLQKGAIIETDKGRESLRAKFSEPGLEEEEK